MISEVLQLIRPEGRRMQDAMAKGEWRWVRVKALTKDKKTAIAAVCDCFIAEVLKPLLQPVR